jgi:hypothetical protein
MRRALRKTFPFFQAILIGAVACVMLAGVALMVSNP